MVEHKSKANKDSKLVWDKSFSVGSPIFDSQHKVLFEIINELQKASEAGAEKKFLLEIISKLYSYSTTHFRDEETLLSSKRPQLLNEQKNQHAIFLDYVIDLESKVKAGSVTVNHDILTFLRVWWEEHIMKIDRQYEKIFV